MIRNNITTWIIYNMSKPEWDKICEDHCNDFDPKELSAHYELMMAEPHNFMIIDYRRPLDSRITERFTKVLRPFDSIRFRRGIENLTLNQKCQSNKRIISQKVLK
jgi:hypothetical protein